jgi:hypothetical protein
MSTIAFQNTLQGCSTSIHGTLDASWLKWTDTAELQARAVAACWTQCMRYYNAPDGTHASRGPSRAETMRGKRRTRGCIGTGCP